MSVKTGHKVAIASGTTTRISTDRILKVAEDEGLTHCLTLFLDRLVMLGVFAKQELDMETQMLWIRGIAKSVKQETERSAAEPAAIRILPNSETVSLCSDCGTHGNCSKTVIEIGSGSCMRTLCSSCIEKRKIAESNIAEQEYEATIGL